MSSAAQDILDEYRSRRRRRLYWASREKDAPALPDEILDIVKMHPARASNLFVTGKVQVALAKRMRERSGPDP